MFSNCFSQDYGIGIAYIVKDKNAPPGVPKYNCMQIYESNFKNANIIGKFIYEGSWKYKSAHFENIK